MCVSVICTMLPYGVVHHPSRSRGRGSQGSEAKTKACINGPLEVEKFRFVHGSVGRIGGKNEASPHLRKYILYEAETLGTKHYSVLRVYSIVRRGSWRLVRGNLAASSR